MSIRVDFSHCAGCWLFWLNALGVAMTAQYGDETGDERGAEQNGKDAREHFSPPAKIKDDK